MIVVAGERAETSTDVDLYRGIVGPTEEDADAIIGITTTWLLSYLLFVSCSWKYTLVSLLAISFCTEQNPN